MRWHRSASLISSGGGLSPEPPLPDNGDVLRGRGEVGRPHLRPQLGDLRLQLHLAVGDEHAEGGGEQAERGEQHPLPAGAEPPHRRR